MRLYLQSINGCRLDCQFPRYISPEIAAAGLPEIQAARADLRSRSAAIIRSSTKCISILLVIASDKREAFA
jgi:hypothetical protein